MAYYRSLKLPLDVGGGEIIPKGKPFPEDKLAPHVLEILVKKGKIGKVKTPPLKVLPGWKTRAGKLVKEDIETIEDFLDASDSDLAKTLRVKPSTVKRYKNELAGWLVAPPKKSG